MVIGISGKYAAGKDEVLRYMKSIIEIETVDLDRLGHEALELKQEQLVQVFGPGILSGGGIDRKILGRIVFNSSEKLDELEKITHPVMKQKTKEFIAGNSEKNIVINAALLFYMGLHELCDTVVWVTAPLLKRLKRTIKRDSLSVFETLKRFHSQRKLRYQQICNNTDIHIIRNDGSITDLHKKTAEFLEKKGLK